jgi:hypothetical protein
MNGVGMQVRAPGLSMKTYGLGGCIAALVVGPRTVTLLHAASKSSLCATLRTLCWGVKPHFIMIRMPGEWARKPGEFYKMIPADPTGWDVPVSTLVLEGYNRNVLIGWAPFEHALHVKQTSAGVYYTDTCGHWCEVADVKKI